MLYLPVGGGGFVGDGPAEKQNQGKSKRVNRKVKKLENLNLSALF